jgi:hypothetical protein
MPLVPARIDAVTLAVADVERSKIFYSDVMGFTLVTDLDYLKSFELGSLQLDIIDRGVLLEETHLADFPQPPGPVTLVIRVERDEVDRAMERLVGAGVRVVAPAEDKPLGPRILYVADPDGHMWEIGCFA